MNGLFTNISLLRKWENALKVTCENKLIYSLENYPNGRNPRNISQNVTGNFNKLYNNNKSLYDTYYKNKHGVDFQSGTLLFTIKNELIIATKDLRRRIGILFLYVDSLYRIGETPSTANGKIWYQYNPTQFDDAYNLEIPIAFEAIYKFWQRVSDLIMIFLPNAMAKNEKGITYFETPFSYIEKHLSELKESEHFQWLLQFKQELCIKGYYECIDFLSQITISIESGKIRCVLSN